MIESQYTAAIHKKLPPHIKKWKVNDNFEGGVPDAFYRDKTGVNGILWIEYKLIPALPKKETTRITPKLSLQQLAWLVEAQTAGETAWVIIGCKDIKDKNGCKGVVLEHQTYWRDGVTPEYFRQNALSYKEIADKIAKERQ